MIYDFLVCVALLVCHCAIVSFGHHVLVVRHNLLISCITVDPHLGPFMRLLILSRGRALLNHVSSFERTVQNHMLLLKCQWKVDRWHEDLQVVVLRSVFCY